MAQHKLSSGIGSKALEKFHLAPPSEVRVTVRSEQWNGQDKPEVITMTTFGILRYDLQLHCWEVSYDESEASGMEGTRTYLQLFDDQRVRLLREGEVEADMVFIKGDRFVSTMQSAFGPLAISVITNIAEGHFTPAGGFIRLSYSVSFGQHENISTKVEMQAQRVKQAPRYS